MLYFDNAATTMVSPSVVAAMEPYQYLSFGNPGSIHQMGVEAKKAVELAREQVASVIHADPKNIIFTSGGTEANNLALTNAVERMVANGKNHMVVSGAEHPSVLRCVEYLQAEFDLEVSYVRPGSDGIVGNKEVIPLLREDTGLVSVMGVNNEIGTVNMVGGIAKLCLDAGILYHTDCVQAYGNVPIDVSNGRVDFLSVSAHKFHGPKGVGFLYAKNPERMRPMVFGGGQEGGLRSGTENVPLIVGMGEAARTINRAAENTEHTAQLMRELFRIVSSVGGVKVNGVPYYGSKILNLRFDGVDGQTLVLMLSGKGVYVSAGSACSARENKPSHVLKGIGLSDDQAKSSIRISISRYTTMEDVVSAAEAIVESVKFLRGE